MLVLAKIDANAADAVAAALTPYLTSGGIEFYSELAPSKPKSGGEGPASQSEELAEKIAEQIRPKPTQALRRKALEAALGGYDTFLDEHGEANPSMRNALGAVSKAMRPLFPLDVSPIDRLVRRVKHYQPGTKFYLGTRYQVTPLGQLVRDRLVAVGAIS